METALIILAVIGTVALIGAIVIGTKKLSIDLKKEIEAKQSRKNTSKEELINQPHEKLQALTTYSSTRTEVESWFGEEKKPTETK